MRARMSFMDAWTWTVPWATGFIHHVEGRGEAGCHIYPSTFLPRNSFLHQAFVRECQKFAELINLNLAHFPSDISHPDMAGVQLKENIDHNAL